MTAPRPQSQGVMRRAWARPWPSALCLSCRVRGTALRTPRRGTPVLGAEGVPAVPSALPSRDRAPQPLLGAKAKCGSGRGAPRPARVGVITPLSLASPEFLSCSTCGLRTSLLMTSRLSEDLSGAHARPRPRPRPLLCPGCELSEPERRTSVPPRPSLRFCLSRHRREDRCSARS